MLLFTDKKLSRQEYSDYINLDKEPNYLFEENDLNMEECVDDVFQEENGSLFTIRNNKIQYFYPDYDFYKLFEKQNLIINSKILLESEVNSGNFIPSQKYLKALKNGADAVLYKTERDNADFEKITNKISDSDYEKLNTYINDKKELALKLLMQNKTKDIDISIKKEKDEKDYKEYSLKADYNNGEHKIAVHYLNKNKYDKLAKEIIGKNSDYIPAKKGKDNKETFKAVYNKELDIAAKDEYRKDKKKLDITEELSYLFDDINDKEKEGK